ncbi:hypothetical protein [Bailinhaonella thermotolerans]|uniref:MFS transporter n=1 Tax=Bailinhaonella thermotolerans TaxID=1070861 RepID=A0A3A4B1S2_9ACTN|nr:hypothetical protein [Bailinhaonella thermotolerans]RJL35685.1 hypothetical protein D5H75_02555 [Bailinhaonella thermotolerans]
MLSTLAASRTDDLPAAGTAQATALTGGYQLAFRVGACLVPGALVIAAVVLRTPPRTAGAPTARVTASLPEKDTTSV